jgi:hypothetical protein
MQRKFLMLKNSEEMYIFYQPHTYNFPSPASQVILICVCSVQ